MTNLNYNQSTLKQINIYFKRSPVVELKTITFELFPSLSWSSRSVYWLPSSIY